ncbi:malate dehydrogenase [Kyrpidia spormannii]|uniref:Malate dehydrogenase n=1 Tax=Kyrpidia spormannii TaxID=2055160 RepID=A0A2K8NB92_9BACL|nr:malate dehydrogenase [Kyrpidia spormannii]ATY85722.1 malate dehydrogenase [Kyrpidia spormannii]
MRRRKITVIGAGNVGAAVAHGLLVKGLGNVVLMDVVEGLAAGKALDLLQSGPVEGWAYDVKGTAHYRDTADSDVVVITAGVARRPGMSREDLTATNARIVWEAAKQAAAYSPRAHIVVVSNPLDVMCYIALRASGFPPNRVYGQSGVLDSSRFRTFIAQELGVAGEDVHAYVLGGHGDEMVPLVRYAYVGCVPVDHLIPQTRLREIVERTKRGGAEIVSLLKQGSAYYAPAASTVQMVQSVLEDRKRILPMSVYLNGQYGLSDIYFGVPAVLGGDGVERMIELNLDDGELAALNRSAETIRRAVAAARDHLKSEGVWC